MIKNETFSIRQMIELTGLSEFTIRGWENRYKAFKPKRSETGRRKYDKTDVERALLIRELLKRGHKISKIAHLKNEKLQVLFKGTENIQNISIENKEVNRALELMALQKWGELYELFRSSQFKNPEHLVHKFILPIISKLAQLVDTGAVSIAQEHIISSYIKEKIYSSLANIDTKSKMISDSKKIKFILVAPEGDHHDIGLLLAHLLIRSKGFNSLYLGPHTPAQDLSETTLRYEASHILISSNISKAEGANQDLLKYVSSIQEKIGSKIKILLAGRQAPYIQNQQNESSILSFFTFLDFESYLNSLKSQNK